MWSSRAGCRSRASGLQPTCRGSWPPTSAKTDYDRLAQQAADEVVLRWVDRLGGARAFTQDHCAAMLMARCYDVGDPRSG